MMRSVIFVHVSLLLPTDMTKAVILWMHMILFKYISKSLVGPTQKPCTRLPRPIFRGSWDK